MRIERLWQKAYMYELDGEWKKKMSTQLALNFYPPGRKLWEKELLLSVYYHLLKFIICHKINLIWINIHDVVLKGN